jgi:prepilin-type processing-associated H-X9-DG protein
MTPQKIIASPRLKALTLIEILVVISVVSLLVAIVIPSLNCSKNHGRKVVCKHNLRQLVLANQSYAVEHRGYAVPGASDIHSGNLHRWYGARPNLSSPFAPSQGPLAGYLSDDQLQCPQNISYDLLPPEHEDYEYGNGGYGYNLTYIGSQVWQFGYEDYSCNESTPLANIRRPQETLMFSDTAMVKWIDGQTCLIRYAFAEPRFFVISKNSQPFWAPYPSIHFRHRKYAAVAWADGHADDRKIGPYDEKNVDGTEPSDYHIGWFEPIDNSPFDLE